MRSSTPLLLLLFQATFQTGLRFQFGQSGLSFWM
jgi:hypothetical protein